MSQLTYEGVLELFAETNKQFSERDRRFDERLSKIAEEQFEFDRRFEERLSKIAEEQSEFDRRFDERLSKRAEERSEFDRRFEERLEKQKSAFQSDLKELTKRISQNSKQIADLGDTLGRFAEEQVRADLINKFEKWGIPVHSMATHFIQRDKKNDYAYEVDILIYNSKYVVAIEVKNTLKRDHVDEHLERMKKMQELPLPDTKGKILLSGVAGMIVSEGVDKYAEKKGLFVLKPSGDTVKIVNDKKTFKPQEWEVN